MNFEDQLFGKPFKCVGLWWLLVARPPTESWFKVAPSPQASGFDFFNTRNVTINDGSSLGHLGHLFSHQEFYSLWWRLLSDMTSWCTTHEDWGTPFYGLFSFAHKHCSFPQGGFAAKLSKYCATLESTFGQCSSNHCNYPHKFAPFIWLCCQIAWPGKSRCSNMRRMRGIVDHSFNDVYLNNVGCLMPVYAMLDRTCTSGPDSFSPPCRLSGLLQAEKSLLIYFIKSDIKVLPWEKMLIASLCNVRLL